jgi:hypothetical protein
MKSKVIDKLNQILPDGFLRTKPLAVMELWMHKEVAATQKLQVFSLPEAKSVLVILREGPRCLELRSQLSNLEPASNIVLNDVNEGQMLLVQKLVEAYDLRLNKEPGVRTNEGVMFKVDVWNLGKNMAQWRDGVLRKIMELAESGCVTYSFPMGLGERRCDIIKEVADEVSLELHGLVSAIEGQGRDRRVHIGFFAKFMDEWGLDFADLAPGDSKEFREDLTLLTRIAIAAAVKEDRDLRFHEAKLGESKWLVTVWRKAEAKLPSPKNRRNANKLESVVYREEPTETEAVKQIQREHAGRVGLFETAERKHVQTYLAKVFNSFARGGTRRTSTDNWQYLRKTDLARLVQEMRKDMPAGETKALCHLESRFEDLCFVKSVIGSDQRDGLSEPAFEALVGQVARQHGWAFVESLVGKANQA